MHVLLISVAAVQHAASSNSVVSQLPGSHPSLHLGLRQWDATAGMLSACRLLRCWLQPSHLHEHVYITIAHRASLARGLLLINDASNSNIRSGVHELAAWQHWPSHSQCQWCHCAQVIKHLHKQRESCLPSSGATHRQRLLQLRLLLHRPR